MGIAKGFAGQPRCLGDLASGNVTQIMACIVVVRRQLQSGSISLLRHPRMPYELPYFAPQLKSAQPKPWLTTMVGNGHNLHDTFQLTVDEVKVKHFECDAP
jgi:hypothetical protein